MGGKGTSLGFALRTAAALGLAALAVPAFRYSHLAYLRSNDPAAAYRANPHDALAVAGAIGARLASDPAFKPAPRDVENLRMALIARPLSPDVLALRGVARDAAGQPRESLTLLHAADRVSRRSALANLALIEAAANSGDVSAAVRYYHAALSVHPDLRPSLLPILAAALTYPEIRVALKPYLARPAPWSAEFLGTAARDAGAAELEALLQPVPQTLLDEDYRPGLAAILRRIALEHGSTVAVRFAAQLVPGFVPATLSDLALSPATSDARLGALAWNFQSGEGIAAELGHDRVLTVTAQPLARGYAAVRDLLVEGGARYDFTQHVAFGTEAAKPGLRWTATCQLPGQGAAAPFWDQRVPASNAPTRYRTPVTVPDGCSLVRFTLELVGPDGQLPATVAVSELGFTRQP